MGFELKDTAVSLSLYVFYRSLEYTSLGGLSPLFALTAEPADGVYSSTEIGIRDSSSVRRLR